MKCTICKKTIEEYQLKKEVFHMDTSKFDFYCDECVSKANKRYIRKNRKTLHNVCYKCVSLGIDCDGLKDEYLNNLGFNIRKFFERVFYKDYYMDW